MLPAVPMSPIDQLSTELSAQLRRDPRGVAELLGRYARDEEDWRPWAFFETAGYTRNLVHRCGDYELLLLCWGEDQVSPIHDHDGQSCWMAVLDGAVEEVHYRLHEQGGLIEGAARSFQRGQVAYIKDEIALHQVRAGAGTRGISLHLYSSPIDSCRVYDRLTGEPSWIESGYHSVRGEICGEKTAEIVRAEWA